MKRTRVIVICTVSLAVLVGVVLYAVTRQPRPVVAPTTDESRICVKDEDCAVVRSDCSLCSCEAIGVNRVRVHEYRTRRFGEFCDELNNIKCNTHCPLFASCVQGRCEAFMQDSPLPTTIPQTKAISFSDDCVTLKQQIEALLAEANTCWLDSDCRIVGEFSCPFGLWQLLFWNADLATIRKGIEKYQAQCFNELDHAGCYVTGDYDPLAAPWPQAIACRERKCVDTRFTPPEFTLELTVPKREFAAGEQMPLKLKITNTSAASLRLPRTPFLQPFLRTTAARNGMEVLTIEHPEYSLGHGESVMGELKPGETWTYDLYARYIQGFSLTQKAKDLNPEKTYPFFSVPGIYSISTELRHANEPTAIDRFWEGVARSNTVFIKVLSEVEIK